MAAVARFITMSRTVFFRLLAHAPEALQRGAKEDARRATPAFCLTEDDVQGRFAQEEQWEELSDVDFSFLHLNGKRPPSARRGTITRKSRKFRGGSYLTSATMPDVNCPESIRSNSGNSR
jgi:hypothetical protein